MNASTKSLIAAATLAIVGTSAFAFEVQQYATPSTLTRAEVKAELLRARNAGELQSSAAFYSQVDQQLAASRNAVQPGSQIRHVVAPVQGESLVSQANEAYGTVVPGENLRSRADVRAEGRAAIVDRIAVDAE